MKYQDPHFDKQRYWTLRDTAHKVQGYTNLMKHSREKIRTVYEDTSFEHQSITKKALLKDTKARRALLGDIVGIWIPS